VIPAYLLFRRRVNKREVSFRISNLGLNFEICGPTATHTYIDTHIHKHTHMRAHIWVAFLEDFCPLNEELLHQIKILCMCFLVPFKISKKLIYLPENLCCWKQHNALHFNIIICDNIMTDMSTFELAREVLTL
jgi:hypothetical protein